VPIAAPLFQWGSRFSKAISRQFRDDLGLGLGDEGYPNGVWSSGKRYSNTLQNLHRGLEVPEEKLYPHYKRVLKADAAGLLDRVDTALARLADDPDSDWRDEQWAPLAPEQLIRRRVPATVVNLDCGSTSYQKGCQPPLSTWIAAPPEGCRRHVLPEG